MIKYSSNTFFQTPPLMSIINVKPLNLKLTECEILCLYVLKEYHHLSLSVVHYYSLSLRTIGLFSLIAADRLSMNLTVTSFRFKKWRFDDHLKNLDHNTRNANVHHHLNSDNTHLPHSQYGIFNLPLFNMSELLIL